MFDPKQPNNSLLSLPGDFEYDKKIILKAAIKANNALAKLNGLALLLPNANLLMAPLLTKESVESNAIENIHTTTFKVLQSEALNQKIKNGPEKEVLHYRTALLDGIQKMNFFNGIPTQLLIDIQAILEPTKKDIRKIPVAIKKGNTVIYTPPQGEKNIRDFLSNLEVFMNNDQQDIDPLIKLGVIHYQFESIHPFSDGNGRTGRILMILYLILTKKLEYPVLFLSEFINTTRSTYYTLLNKTNQSNDYTGFILYILEAIIKQSNVSATKIIEIQNLMKEVQQKLASENLDYHKITTTLFSYPFISVSNLGEKIGVSRQTMTRYIPKLENTGLISTSKVGRSTLIYIPRFITILS